MKIVDHIRGSEELERAVSAYVVHRWSPISTFILAYFDRTARACPHIVVVVRDTEIVPTHIVVDMLNVKRQRVRLQTH